MKPTTIIVNVLIASLSVASSAASLPSRKVASPTYSDANVPSQAPTPKSIQSARKVGPPTSLTRRDIPEVARVKPVPASVRTKIMSSPISTKLDPLSQLVDRSEILSVPRPKNKSRFEAIKNKNKPKASKNSAKPVESLEADQPRVNSQALGEDQETELEVIPPQEASDAMGYFEDMISELSEAGEELSDFANQDVDLVSPKSVDEDDLLEQVAIDSFTADETILDETESKRFEVLRFETDVVAPLTKKELEYSFSDTTTDDDVLESSEGEPEANGNAESDNMNMTEEDLVREVIVESNQGEEYNPTPTEDESKSLEVVESADETENQDTPIQQPIPMAGKLPTSINSQFLNDGDEPGASPSCIYSENGCDYKQGHSQIFDVQMS